MLNLGNIKGADGIGITKSEINSSGELVLTYSDGTTVNLGKVKGEDGQDGADGRGIQNVSISIDGELIVTYTDSTVVNLGNIKGEKGEKGDRGEKGDQGAAGRGIAKTEIVNGELIITYTDDTKENLGGITSEYADVEYLKFTKLYGDKCKVALKDEYRTTIKSVKIPLYYKGTPITYIEGFNDCVNLEQIILPDTLTNIMPNCFKNCSKLKNIDIPNSVYSIGESAFMGSAVNSVLLPNKLKFLGMMAFKNCTSLKSVVFSGAYTDEECVIDQFAFWKCTSLVNVVLSDNIKQINDKCFYCCESLEIIKLPQNLTRIGFDAFSRTKLSELTIPKSVLFLGSGFIYNPEETFIKLNFEETNGWKKCPVSYGTFYGNWSDVEPGTIADSDVMIDLVMRQYETFEYNGKLYSGKYALKRTI